MIITESVCVCVCVSVCVCYSVTLTLCVFGLEPIFILDAKNFPYIILPLLHFFFLLSIFSLAILSWNTTVGETPTMTPIYPILSVQSSSNPPSMPRSLHSPSPPSPVRPPPANSPHQTQCSHIFPSTGQL